jgi:hypothetical protein
MKPQDVRRILLIYPVLALASIFLVLLLQQAFYENELPENIRALPRIDVPEFNQLVVTNATGHEAFLALQDAQMRVAELDRLGIPHQSFDDSLEVMRKAYDGENVSELMRRAELLNQTPGQEAVARDILDLVQKSLASGQKLGANYSFVVEQADVLRQNSVYAIKGRDALRLLDLTLNDVEYPGLNLSDARELQRMAEAEYSAERFSKVFSFVNGAFDSAESAQVELSKSRAFFKSSRRTILYFVVDYWKWLLLAGSVLLVVSLFVNNEVQIRLLSKRLESAEHEKKSVPDLIGDLQEKYYSLSIGKTVYDVTLRTLHDKTVQLRSEIPLLQQQIRRRVKWSVLRLFKRGSK